MIHDYLKNYSVMLHGICYSGSLRDFSEVFLKFQRRETENTSRSCKVLSVDFYIYNQNFFIDNVPLTPHFEINKDFGLHENITVENSV